MINLNCNLIKPIENKIETVNANNFSLLERLSNTRDSSINKTSTPINTLSHLRIVPREKELGEVIKGKKNIDTSQMTLLKFYGMCYFWEVERL